MLVTTQPRETIEIIQFICNIYYIFYVLNIFLNVTNDNRFLVRAQLFSKMICVITKSGEKG